MAPQQPGMQQGWQPQDGAGGPAPTAYDQYSQQQVCKLVITACFCLASLAGCGAGTGRVLPEDSAPAPCSSTCTLFTLLPWQALQQPGPGDYYAQQHQQAQQAQQAGGWGQLEMQGQQGGPGPGPASQAQWGAGGWQGGPAGRPAGGAPGGMAGPSSPQYYGSGGFSQPAQQGGPGAPWQGMDAQPPAGAPRSWICCILGSYRLSLATVLRLNEGMDPQVCCCVMFSTLAQIRCWQASVKESWVRRLGAEQGRLGPGAARARAGHAGAAAARVLRGAADAPGARVARTCRAGALRCLRASAC